MTPLSCLGVSMDENPRVETRYKWKRVLLKVSGEALAGDRTENIDPKVLEHKFITPVSNVTNFSPSSRSLF
jgi:hypothetical protein